MTARASCVVPCPELRRKAIFWLALSLFEELLTRP